MPGLILEGVVGVGKTSVFRALKAHPRFAARPATLALPEHYTERAYEHWPERGVPESLALLERVLAPIGALSGLFADSKFAGDERLSLAWLVDRLHLSHAMMFAQGEAGPYAATEAWLLEQQGKLALLTVSQERLADRLARTRQTRHAGWSWYLDTLVARRTPGMDDAEVERVLVAHYAAQQEAMRAMARSSRLPVAVVETDREDWGAIADQLVDFWDI